MKTTPTYLFVALFLSGLVLLAGCLTDNPTAPEATPGEAPALSLHKSAEEPLDQIPNPGFENNAEGWNLEVYEPFLGYSEPHPGICQTLLNAPPFVTRAIGTTSAAFESSSSVELSAAIDCNGGSIGQLRMRSAAQTQDLIRIPTDPTKQFITFYVRMADGVACRVATGENCFPYVCQFANYDAQNYLGVLLKNSLRGQKRTTLEFHGTHAGLCSTHVTETISSSSLHAFFDTPSGVVLPTDPNPPADGARWFRYTVPIDPVYVADELPVQIGVSVDHFQNFASKGATRVFVDSMCLSDSQGNCNDNTVTICHKPGTKAEKTLVLPFQALAGHLGHGDTVGPCQ